MPTEFPISDTITVNISRETLFPSSDGFGTIVVAGTDSEIDFGERVRYYTSIDAVALDFDSTKEENIAASAAFSQSPKPVRIGIARVLTASPSGFMKCGAAGLPAVFAAVSDGTFTISIDADPQDITAVDFTGDVTLADVAATLQVALRAIASGGYTLCLVTDEDGRLKIASGTTGASSTVSALTPEGTGTDLSGATYMNGLDSVASVFDGYDYTNFTTELDLIEAADDDWYSLALTRDLKSVVNYQAAAAWVEARIKILGAFDNSLIALDPSSVLDLGFLLKASNYARTFTIWNQDSTTYPEVSALARLATVDYEIPNSAITLKFQQLPGITPVSISTTQRNALITKNYGVYVQRGGVNMLEEGKMASGEFTDVIHGVDWLGDTIGIRVFGELFAESNKIAMTDAGVARLEQKVKEVLDTATEANLIATDFDDNGTLVPSYTITTVAILNHPEAERSARKGAPISFVGRLAGAIHSQTVTGVVTV